MLVDRSRLEKIQDSEGLSKRIGRHGTDGRGHSQKLVCTQQKARGFPEACLCPAEGWRVLQPPLKTRRLAAQLLR